MKIKSKSIIVQILIMFCVLILLLGIALLITLLIYHCYGLDINVADTGEKTLNSSAELLYYLASSCFALSFGCLPIVFWLFKSIKNHKLDIRTYVDDCNDFIVRFDKIANNTVYCFIDNVLNDFSSSNPIKQLTSSFYNFETNIDFENHVKEVIGEREIQNALIKSFEKCLLVFDLQIDQFVPQKEKFYTGKDINKILVINYLIFEIGILLNRFEALSYRYTSLNASISEGELSIVDVDVMLNIERFYIAACCFIAVEQDCFIDKYSFLDNSIRLFKQKKDRFYKG